MPRHVNINSNKLLFDVLEIRIMGKYKSENKYGDINR